MRRLASHHTWPLHCCYSYRRRRSGGSFALTSYTSPLTWTTNTRQVSSRASAAAFYHYVHKLNASYVSHNNNNNNNNKENEQTNTNITIHTRNSGDDAVKADQTHLVETWHVRPSRPDHTLHHTTSHTASHKGRGEAEEEEGGGGGSVIAMPASTQVLQAPTQPIVNAPLSSSSSSLYADDMRLVRQLQGRVRRHVSDQRRHEMCEAVCKAYDIACEVYTVLCKEIDEPIEAYMANKKRKKADRQGVRCTTHSSPSVSFRPCHPSLEMIVHERVGQLQRTLRGLHTTHYDVMLLYETEAIAQHMHRSARAHHVLRKRLRTLRRTSYKNYSNSHGSSRREHQNGQEDDVVVHPLLVFTEVLVGILRSLRRLPRRTAGRVTASQAETYARTCGAAHAIRDMLSVLVHNDQRAIQPTHSNSKSGDEQLQQQMMMMSSGRKCGLRCENVLLLFDAVLALSSEDSPSFTLPVYYTHRTNTTPMMNAQLYMSHTARKKALPNSSESANVVMLTMNAEEWCVRRLLSFPGLKLRVHPVQEANKATEKEEEEEKEEAVTTQFARCAAKTSKTRTAADGAGERAHELTLRQAVSVVRRCMYSFLSITNSTITEGSSNTSIRLTGMNTATPHVSLLRIPYGLGKAMTEWLLAELALWLPNDRYNSTIHTPMMSNAVLDNIHVHDLATLCSAVLFFRCYNSVVALHVLLATAPRCVRQAEELSGPDIANMLLAYASLKYKGDIHHNDQHHTHSDSSNDDAHNEEREEGAGSDSNTTQQQQRGAQKENGEDVLQNFYLVLGTRAGQLADSLSEEDVVKVLRAFEMTAIKHHTLRASLESSLRMRNVYKAPTYG